jgi:hypothetical protein
MFTSLRNSDQLWRQSVAEYGNPLVMEVYPHWDWCCEKWDLGIFNSQNTCAIWTLALCQYSLCFLNFSYMLHINIHSSICYIFYWRWKRTSDNWQFIVEIHDLLLLRVKYLCATKAYRADGRPVVYADETYTHSSHITSHAWDDGLGAGLKAPLSKGHRLIIIHSGNRTLNSLH